MDFTQQEDKQFFRFTEMTFLDVKTLRDALKNQAKGGSAHAAKLVKEIEEKLEKMDV